MHSFITSITELLANPIFWIILLGYYLVSSLIGGMEMPDEHSSKAYRYWFKVLNKFAANLDRAASAADLPHVEGQK